MISFNTFLVDLHRLIDGDENAPSDPQDLPLATLQQVIRLAEARIYRDARTRYNEVAFDGVTVTDNLAPLPADFEAPSLVHFGNGPLRPVSENELIERNLCSPSGEARYFAKAGADLTFSPVVADGTELQGRYYCRLPALTVATAPTNELFQNENPLFIYACLLEAAPIFKKFADLQTWGLLYEQIKSEANKRHAMAAYSVGRMQVSPSTRLMR